mmetsp:Transcript_41509/g.74608  ORF Transcript_41509/g.74608 Transcript_41509/m.74608 type:complete len:225 (-) Transcript_41509:96-770(-)
MKQPTRSAPRSVHCPTAGCSCSGRKYTSSSTLSRYRAVGCAARPASRKRSSFSGKLLYFSTDSARIISPCASSSARSALASSSSCTVPTTNRSAILDRRSSAASSSAESGNQVARSAARRASYSGPTPLKTPTTASTCSPSSTLPSFRNGGSSAQIVGLARRSSTPTSQGRKRRGGFGRRHAILATAECYLATESPNKIPPPGHNLWRIIHTYLPLRLLYYVHD